MRTRYLTNAIFLVAGALLLVTSQAFGVDTFTWIMLASGIGMLAMAASAAALSARGVVQRWLDGATSVLGAWTIVAAVVFGGMTVNWLGFASGAGLFAFALIGLTLHELRTERVVHALDVGSSTRPAGLAGAR